ncbi:MAG TPA: hypothetical protein VGD81_16365 [Opitutaceae bacterium]
MRDKFPEGHIADAWWAAHAEHLAGKIGATAPEWAFAPWRIDLEDHCSFGGQA